MSVTVNAKELLEGIKKVIKVTNASSLNFYFSEGNVKITAMLNQYRMELNQKIECQDTFKFCIFTDVICPVLENKETVTFSLDGNSLKFKSGRSRGSLVTLLYEDIPFEESSGTPLDDTIKTFLFKNLDRVNYTGKNVSTNIPLKVQIKDEKIKMLGMEMNYSGLIIEPMEGVDDAEFNILLKYAEYITTIFPEDEKLKIYSTDSSVEIYSDSCKVVLPKIADGESNSIEDMEQIIKANVIPENLQGKILFKSPKDFLEDINELQKFVNDAGAKIQIIRKDEESSVDLQVNTSNGKLQKKLTEDCAVSGTFDAQFNLDNFKTCVEKNVDGNLLISFYSTFCTIKNDKSKNSIYMVVVIR